MRILSVLAIALVLPSAANAASSRTTICHRTSSATNPFNIITVANSALPAHSTHGDFVPFSAYADRDGDGYGDASRVASGLCAIPAGYVANRSDCNDAQASVHPGADEVCNDADDDCDTTIDEDASDAGSWFADNDYDGYGDAGDSVEACDAPTGSVPISGDCDDDAFSVNPGGTEVCNDVDDDCDVAIDEYAADASTWFVDGDGDGSGSGSSSIQACDAPLGYSSARAIAMTPTRTCTPATTRSATALTTTAMVRQTASTPSTRRRGSRTVMKTASATPRRRPTPATLRTATWPTPRTVTTPARR